MKLDCLVIAAHPDDAEISVGGTLLKLAQAGKKTGIVDVTRGELGTRGSAEDRALECSKASELLGLSVRNNLDAVVLPHADAAVCRAKVNADRNAAAFWIC